MGTAGYLVMVLAHHLPVWSLPSIVAVMGYTISFAAGSAFGTMGVMFPLTLPLGVFTSCSRRLACGKCNWQLHCIRDAFLNAGVAHAMACVFCFAVIRALNSHMHPHACLVTLRLSPPCHAHSSAYEVSGGDEHVVMLCSSAILGSSVFGNHCSPIADNTVLSSLSTGCDIGSHFRTTVPYAMLLAGVSIVFGFLPYGLFHWYGGVLGLLVATAVLLGSLMVFGERADESGTSDAEDEDAL